jgi:glycosyltransferase involved in cell wall biosynthesis
LLIPVLLTLFYIRSLILLIRLRPDVVVAHQLDTLPVALVLRGLRRDLRVVFDREDIYELMVYPDVPRILHEIIRMIEYELSTRADLWIFPNEGTRNYAPGKPRMRTIIVPNVPETGFAGNVLESLEIKNRVHHPFRIAYLGTVNAHLGVDVLIKAIGQLRENGNNVEAIIIGNGPYLSDAKRLANQVGAVDAIRFLGRVQRERVPELLSSCDASAVLVTPSSPLMGLIAPNKLFESMTLGIPVIASNFGTLAQIVKETRCGILVDPSNITLVADAIRELSRDRSLWTKLSRNCIAAMNENYSWNLAAGNLISGIRELRQVKSTRPS